MLFSRTFGIALLAMISVVTFSVTTDSASNASTVLCTVNETPCPAPNILGAGTAIKGNVTGASQGVLKAEKANQEALPNITCQKSEVEGIITGSDGTQLLGELTKANLLECTAGKLFNCTVEVLQLPYSASGTYVVQGDAAAVGFAKAPNEQPGVRVSCPIVGLNCIFKVSETNTQNGAQGGNLSVAGGAPATVTASQVVLKMATPVGGNCLNIKVARVDGTGSVSTPNPAYASKDQP